MFAVYLISLWLEQHQKCPQNKQERQNPSALRYTPSSQKTEPFNHAGGKAWENGCSTAASQEMLSSYPGTAMDPSKSLLLLIGALGDTESEKFSLLQGQLLFACLLICLPITLRL